MSSIKEARDFIAESDYNEFPETVLHAQLCIAFARSDKRSIPQALRAFALARMPKIQNRNLHAALAAMSKSLFPEAELTRIKGCIAKMETSLRRELKALNS